MAGEVTLGDVYFPLVTLYQWALVAFILSAGRVDAPRAAVALVIGLNGLQTFSWILELRGLPSPFDHPWNFVGLSDDLILITLPFVLSQFPTPVGGPRGARLAARAWLALVVAHSALWLALYRHWTLTGRGFGFISDQLGARLVPGLALVAAAVLLSRVLRRSGGERPGPLRTQSLLVAAGIGIGLAYTSTGFFRDYLFAFASGMPASWVALGASAPLGYAAVAFAAFAALSSGARRRVREVAAVGAVLAAGLVLGAHDVGWLWFRGGYTSELVTQTIRPLLVGVALLRYDLFRAPVALRRPLVPATAVVLVVALFVLLSIVFGGDSLASATLDPAGAVAAVVVVAAAAYVSRHAMLDIFAHVEPDDMRRRLDRYRLALERARLGASDDLERLRRDLGITRREHEAIAAVLEGRVLVPASAIRGAEPGEIVAGRYEVVRELGRGGAGLVHLARDRSTGADVVLKEVVRPWEADAASRRAALEREAGVSRRVSSPHVARVHGLVVEPFRTCVVRDYVPGRTLADEITAAGALPPPRALALLADVGRGLDALHAAGLLHLDVKPENVVVTPEGRAVLVDQGAARPAARADGTRTMSPGSDAWTPRYAAPEQLVGGAVDARTDVYQAAGLLYVMLTGEPPVAGSTAAEVEAAVLGGAPLRWPAVVDPALRAAVERARSRDPRERPADARELLAALAAAAAA